MWGERGACGCGYAFLVPDIAWVLCGCLRFCVALFQLIVQPHRGHQTSTSLLFSTCVGRMLMVLLW